MCYRHVAKSQMKKIMILNSWLTPNTIKNWRKKCYLILSLSRNIGIGRGGSSFSLRGGGGAMVENLIKKITIKGSRGPSPGFFYFQRFSQAIQGISGTVSHSVYHQIIKKALYKVMIFFLRVWGGGTWYWLSLSLFALPYIRFTAQFDFAVSDRYSYKKMHTASLVRGDGLISAQVTTSSPSL